MKIGSLFSGYGGLDLGVQAVLGGEVAWHVEYDKAPSAILAHHFPDIPNYGDVTALDFTSVEPVDVLTGGYPCQPFSHAGNRKGTDDERHLWPHVLRALSEMGPRLAILENVRGHLTLGFDTVLADLAQLGWSAEWGIVRASDAGAPHQRARLFILAYPEGDGWHERWPESAGIIRRSNAAQCSDGIPTDASSGQQPGPASNGNGLRLAAERSYGVTADASGERYGGRQDLGVVGGMGAAPDVIRWQTGTPRQVVGDRSAQNATHATRSKRTDAQPEHLCEASEQTAEPRERVAWGDYGPAIQRWSDIIGRPAPSPTEPRPNGEPRLAPRFVEWMMGLPDGWVTDPAIGISRNHQLKALGNGVVPQQAALALSLLLPRVQAVAA